MPSHVYLHIAACIYAPHSCPTPLHKMRLHARTHARTKDVRVHLIWLASCKQRLCRKPSRMHKKSPAEDSTEGDKFLNDYYWPRAKEFLWLAEAAAAILYAGERKRQPLKALLTQPPTAFLLCKKAAAGGPPFFRPNQRRERTLRKSSLSSPQNPDRLTAAAAACKSVRLACEVFFLFLQPPAPSVRSCRI